MITTPIIDVELEFASLQKKCAYDFRKCIKKPCSSKLIWQTFHQSNWLRENLNSSQFQVKMLNYV